jgi:hypothetical protein
MLMIYSKLDFISLESSFCEFKNLCSLINISVRYITTSLHSTGTFRLHSIGTFRLHYTGIFRLHSTGTFRLLMIITLW